MSAFVELVEIDELVIRPLRPTSRGLIVLAGKDTYGSRNRDVGGIVEVEMVFPIKASRGNRCVRQPVERKVVEHIVSCQVARGMSIDGTPDSWILPTDINGIPFGDFSLAAIKKTVAQELIDQMVAGQLSPKSIQNYFQVVKMVSSSCVNEDGEEIYPRNWGKMGLVIPKVIKKKQRRQCFTVKVMNHLANSPTIKPQIRMLFILCGASGLRIGEALGIRIEKILENGTRIIIDEKAWHGEIHDYLKTENVEREIDLPDNVAKLLVEFIGDRKSGHLFRSRSG